MASLNLSSKPSDMDSPWHWIQTDWRSSATICPRSRTFMSQHPGMGQSESPHALIITSFSWCLLWSAVELQKQTSRKKKTAFSHKPWSSLNLPIASPLKQNTTIQRDNRFDTHTVLYRVSQNWYHQHQAPKLMSKELIRQNQILLSDKRAKFCSYIL